MILICNVLMKIMIMVMINDINNNDLGNDIIVQYTTVLATVSSADRSSWDSLTGAESCFSIKSVSRANLGYDLLCLPFLEVYLLC